MLLEPLIHLHIYSFTDVQSCRLDIKYCRSILFLTVLSTHNLADSTRMQAEEYLLTLLLSLSQVVVFQSSERYIATAGHDQWSLLSAAYDPPTAIQRTIQGAISQCSVSTSCAATCSNGTTWLLSITDVPTKMPAASSGPWDNYVQSPDLGRYEHFNVSHKLHIRNRWWTSLMAAYDPAHWPDTELADTAATNPTPCGCAYISVSSSANLRRTPSIRELSFADFTGTTGVTPRTSIDAASASAYKTATDG